MTTQEIKRTQAKTMKRRVISRYDGNMKGYPTTSNVNTKMRLKSIIFTSQYCKQNVL